MGGRTRVVKNNLIEESSKFKREIIIARKLFKLYNHLETN